MKIHSKFATDTAAEINGTWQDIGDGASIKVARYGNDEFEKAKTRWHKKNRHATEMPEDLTCELIGLHILKDWKGIESEDGKAIPYTPAAAKKLLLELRDFRNIVVAYSLDHEAYRKAALEKSAKNSGASSAGS